jgi:hypothetical protein
MTKQKGRRVYLTQKQIDALYEATTHMQGCYESADQGYVDQIDWKSQYEAERKILRKRRITK